MLPIAADRPTPPSSPPSPSGFVSFVSPCVLPLVPGYLSAVSGVSVTDMREGERDRSGASWARRSSSASRSRIMFVALGMTATGLGSTLRDSKETLDKVAGILIVALGVFFLLTPFVPAPEPGVAARRAHPPRRRRRPDHRRRRLRRRVDAVHRPDARRRSSPPPRRRTPSRTAASCWPSTRWGSRSLPAHGRRLRSRDHGVRLAARLAYVLITALSGCILIVMGALS